MRTTVYSLLMVFTVCAATAQSVPAPAAMEGLSYPVEFFPETAYDPAVPTPDELLGFQLGSRAAFPAEIQASLEAWAEASPRARLVEYARSHEGRALSYMIVSSEANMARLDAIKSEGSQLADGRTITAADAEALLAEHPGVAWMAYSIHGDETSGSDASLAVLHHLLAGTSEDVRNILDNVVVLVDSMQNPDGRHRFLQQVAEHRAAAPNVDDQSLMHRGYWPWGRTNHYLFDLNRDWALGVNPEARGRIAAAGAWHPQLMVDAHEMGSQDSFLFSPARGPLNPHRPAAAEDWNALFARDQSKAFDARQWVYYTGEWNEGWYPGYTDAWGSMRGAIGILYEQAGYVEDGVRRAGGDIATYREAIHHQAVSSIANLKTLADNRVEILRDYTEDRRSAVAATGPYADRVFAVLPTENNSRLRRLVELADLQGFEMFRLTEDVTVTRAVDQIGRKQSQRKLPKGTLLIPNRQPEARQIATMFGFDERMPTEYLERERKSILRNGQSTIYDVTAWNLTMLHGLEALEVSGGLPDAAVPFGGNELAVQLGAAASDLSEPAVSWIVEGADDASVAFAARLLEAGVGVRFAEKHVELGDLEFSRGSIVILPADNRRFEGDLGLVVATQAAELGLEAQAVSTGLGAGDLPDLGGGHFQRLEAPKIALVARGGINSYDYGSIWHTLDTQLGIRHSQLDATFLGGSDLRRYNVIVLPDRWFSSLSESEVNALKSWVNSGGTLIAIGSSATALAEESADFSGVRQLKNVLEDLDGYEQAVLRETMALDSALPASSAVWSQSLPVEGDYPWAGLSDLERPDSDEAKRQDEWDRMFMPQGAFLAARTDAEHWLTVGGGDVLPILVNSDSVLMSKPPVETPVRLGVLEPASGPALRNGWSVIPKNYRLSLRMSGLLWPEAAGRLANSAAVTRERMGRGQLILFANTPTFRASTHGTARLLLNALIYGPGLGANPPITP